MRPFRSLLNTRRAYFSKKGESVLWKFYFAQGENHLQPRQTPTANRTVACIVNSVRNPFQG